jgi:AraC family transcriptional regulator
MVEKLPPGSFFGRMLSRQVLAGIIVLESAYTPNLRIPPHEHAEAFFDFVLDGGCSETNDGRTRDRQPLTLAFHPAGEVHSSCWHGSEPRCLHIEIAPLLLSRVRQYSPVLDRPAYFPEGTAGLLATRLYNEFQHSDDVSPLVIEGLALELLGECARPASRSVERRPPRWLAQVRDLLNDRFAEHLTLDNIADSVGVHPAHLGRVFRHFHGCTIGAYVRKVRIDVACRCLATSDTSLVEVALATGFADQSHFSRTFKRQTAMSPAAFRKSFARRTSDTAERSPGTRT